MSNQDCSAEQHFTTMMRYFCTRVVQSVVQSRMGKDYKVSQPCNLNNDNLIWFNIVIDEIGEIAAHLKQKMNKYSSSIPFCLEFTLHTADGGYLPMELWVIWLDKNYTDENADIRSVVYSQLTTLLKSVIVAARFTPIYRHYVSIQRLDTFVILYKVKIGKPDLSILGEECKFRQLGNLPTPFGAVRMDLYYRTKIVLLPPPLIEDDNTKNLSRKLSTNSYGNIVPEKNSSIIMSSPVLEDVNYFSTSPLNQDFPFVDVTEEKKKNLDCNIDSSPSSNTEVLETNVIRHASEGNVKLDATNSPKTPSSFPQRTRQLRIRNNSFPFASLLMMDLNLSNDSFRSQILPKVPEDVAIANTLHVSTSDRGLSNAFNNKLRFSTKKKKCSSSYDSKIVEKDLEEKQLCIISKQKEEVCCNDKDFQTKKKVIFGCTIEDDFISQTSKETNDKETFKELSEKNKTNREIKEDDDSEFQSFSSDDSYVKVVAFASTDNLYSDLTDFAQEMHLAPKDLASCLTESAKDLTKQIDEFRDRATLFDDFVASLREMDENQ